MTTYNTTVWQKSDGWSNGGMFQTGWRADHISFANSVMTLQLDNSPGCSTYSTTCSKQPVASGEYKSINMVSYGDITFRAKAAKASGVITGLFTYTGPSDSQPHDEIDIEIIGNNTTQVQFNYFVAGVGNHEKVVALGFDASQAMHDYTIKWLPSSISWYVDGVLKHTVNAGAGVTLPSNPQHIFANLWAATGVDSWSGAFTYSTPLTAQVDAIHYSPAVGSTTTTTPAATPAAKSGGCIAISSADSPYSAATLWLLMVIVGGVLLQRRGRRS
ncbi:MAG: family 16 glycosylhydrolase [Mariprofundales bacterium]|nr:family 16 glycosylhydrolase [Mariprofundales bacterium]